MNFFAITGCIQGAIFKHIAKEGVSIIEYCFFRNVWIGGFAACQVCYMQMNPFKGFPRNLIKDLVIRSLNGQFTFALMNIAVTLLPMSTSFILFQMNPFWIAVLACIMLGERIRMIEVIGIAICFGGVVMITVSKSQQEDGKDETDDTVAATAADGSKAADVDDSDEE